MNGVPGVTTRRILLVMPDPPLPFGNAAARWYYVLLKGLVERGNDVSAFAACSDRADVAAARELFPAPDYKLRVFPYPKRGTGLRSKWETFRQPYSYMFGPDLKRSLQADLDRGFDILHLEQVWAGWLGLRHVDQALLNVHYLVDIDLAKVRHGNPGTALRRAVTRRAERRILGHYRTITALTDRLAARVATFAPRASVHTVPLGMDLGFYPRRRIDYAAPGRHPTVSLIGSFNWEPTQSAARRLLTRLWPEIVRRVPAARLQIVGRDAKSTLREFAGTEAVSIFENVPDIMPYFYDADVMLYAPTRGSGMKVKVLEAFALGVPVVTNEDGVEGLPVLDGVHADVTDEDAVLIDRTVALLEDPGLRARRADAARSLVEQHCDPDRVIDILEAVYETVRRERGAECG